MPRSTAKTDARTRLLDAALSVIRARGYSATSVDELCAAAGFTKGAFFHHFKSEDELGVAAADHWSATTGAVFADAPHHAHAAPLDRVLGYLEFRKALLQGGVPEFTCLVGTMVQETYATSPAIGPRCCPEVRSTTRPPGRVSSYRAANSFTSKSGARTFSCRKASR